MTGWFDIRIQSAAIVLFIACPPTSALGAADVDLTTGLNVGSRIGLFANVYTSSEDVSTGQDSGVASTQATLTPSLRLSVSNGRTSFQTNYQIDLSNSVVRRGEFALNIFQQAGLQLSTGLTRTLNFVLNGYGNIGILDYNSALYVFDTNSDIAANLPQVSKLRFFNVFVDSTLTKRFSALSSGSISVQYQTRRPYGNGDSVETPYSIQDVVSAAPAYNRAISKRAGLTLEISGSLVLHSPGIDYIPVSATIDWEYRPSNTSTLRLSAGATMVDQLGINLFPQAEDVDEQLENHIFGLPQGNLSYQKSFNFRERKSLATEVSGGVDAYFDQVTASLRQQVQLRIGLVLRLSSEWAVAARGSMSALWIPKGSPIDTGTNVSNIDYPANAFVSLDATYRISREIELQFGITSSARMANLWDSEFRARAFEEFLFVVTVRTVQNFLE